MGFSIKDLSISKFVLKKEKVLQFNGKPISESANTEKKKAKTVNNSKNISIKPDKQKKYWFENSWKEGIRIIGNTKYNYRSSWEANYARYLEYLRVNGKIKGWQHEPDTFYFKEVKRGLKAYIPDFKVFLNEGGFVYHEVKGHMDSKAKTKLKRFSKYYPQHTLIVIDNKWFSEFKKSGIVLSEWEK